MYELLLKDDVVDKAPLNSLEQAKIFFMKRKQMTKEQFGQKNWSKWKTKFKKEGLI